MFFSLLFSGHYEQLNVHLASGNYIHHTINGTNRLKDCIQHCKRKNNVSVTAMQNRVHPAKATAATLVQSSALGNSTWEKRFAKNVFAQNLVRA